MALLDNIFGGGVGSLVKDVVGTFKLSPEAKAEIDKNLEDHKFELAKLDAEMESKLAETAGQNIRAEAGAGWYTACARPTFLYIVEAILAYNYIVAPIFGRMPVPLPGDLLTLFGACVLGYVGGRSYEKVMTMRFNSMKENE